MVEMAALLWGKGRIQANCLASRSLVLPKMLLIVFIDTLLFDLQMVQPETSLMLFTCSIIIYIMYMCLFTHSYLCGCEHICAMVCRQRSEDKLMLVFTFHLLSNRISSYPPCYVSLACIQVSKDSLVSSFHISWNLLTLTGFTLHEFWGHKLKSS